MNMMNDSQKSEQKCRIFCVITLGEIGGAQEFVAQLATNLDPERFVLTVVTGSGGRQDLASRLPKHIAWRVASHLVRAISPFSDIRAVYQLRRMITDFSPDIVLLNSSKAGFIGGLAARGLRTRMPHLRVVYRIGGWTFNDPWPAWKRKLYMWLERYSAGTKDIILVNNRHDLEQARTMGIRPRQGVALAHNGVDPYFPMMGRNDARRELAERIEHMTGSRPELGMVAGIIANFYPAKGLLSLLDAAALTPEHIQFLIIGDGALRPDLERRIGELGLEHRVFLCGILPEARRYLPAFDLFVLPSLKEGFPWSLLEAMAAKIPVVATTVGAVPEILQDGRSGLLVPPGDSVAMADAISRMADGERLRADVVIQAHQELLARFTLRTMVSRYEKLFTALCRTS